MNKKVKISAGIVTFNRASMLKDVLTSLANQSVKLNSIFIINNASSDDTSAEVTRLKAELKLDQLVLINNSSNEGSAGGFFKASEACYNSGADWIWLMDDDAIPTQDALENLLKSPVASRPNLGGLGCHVVGEDGSTWLANLQCKVDRNSFSFSPISLPKNISDPVRSDTNSFDGFMVHRRAIEALGFPKRDLFLWWDDIQFSLRISKQFEIWVVPNSLIIHKGKPQNTEEKHPWIKSSLETYSWQDSWKMYYRSRNFYSVLGETARTKKIFTRATKHLIKELLTPVLLNQDHAVERIKLSLRAVYDGLFQRLGKSVELKPPFRKI